MLLNPTRDSNKEMCLRTVRTELLWRTSGLRVVTQIVAFSNESRMRSRGHLERDVPRGHIGRLIPFIFEQEQFVFCDALLNVNINGFMTRNNLEKTC